MTVPPKPEPISKPLVAGSDIIACAILASSRSKTGSPSAAGTPVQMHATAPPMESFSTLTCRISVAIRHAVGGCGQRSGSSSSVRLVPHLQSIESGVGSVPLCSLSAPSRLSSQLHLGESRRISANLGAPAREVDALQLRLAEARPVVRVDAALPILRVLATQTSEAGRGRASLPD